MANRLAPVFLGAFTLLAAGSTATMAKDESLEESYCRLIETSAHAYALPVAFFTRLIWRESSFRADVTSPAGAQGVAQFMPATANEVGLANPFDPEEAIPKAAKLLSDLKQRFGSIGLAAAAYNAGPGRVSSWLAGGFIPAETRDYVYFITGHTVEDWKADATGPEADVVAMSALNCSTLMAKIRLETPARLARSQVFAPWGVQLAGGFSKAAALAQYDRARKAYASVLEGLEPMVIGGRVRSRGFGAFYRVRAPAQTRAGAQSVCARILSVGGACVVLRS